MKSAVAMWLFFRFVRWMSWLVFFGFNISFLYNRAPHLTNFGHLSLTTEMIMFGSALVGIAAGFLELMMRERAGLARSRGSSWRHEPIKQ